MKDNDVNPTAGQGNPANPAFEAAQAMGNLWVEWATKMATAGMAFRAGSAPPDTARDMRDSGFEAMANSTDRFMRTPQFMEMMKQSLDASIAFRRQLNDLFTQAQHSVQGVAKRDVDGVTKAVRRVETRVLARIEELCDRLDAMSRRLDAMEGRDSNHEDNGSAAKAKLAETAAASRGES